MIRSNQPDHDAFADWLDTRQPDAPVASDDVLAAREGALRIDGLNRRLERDILAVAPGRTPLESILSAASVPPPTLGMPDHSISSQRKDHQVDSPFTQPVAPVPIGRIGTGNAFTRIISIAAVVSILLAASATVWFSLDRLGIGSGGDGPESLSYATFVLPSGQEVEIAYDVPSAEECTVEPLSVDEMMAKLDAPYYSQESADAKATEIANAESGPSSTDPARTPAPTMADSNSPVAPTQTSDVPLPTETAVDVDPTMSFDGEGEESYRSHNYTLPEPTYYEIATAQREWLACSLFGTPFQRWALETDQKVQNDFRQLYMPVIDMALIRQDLEDLAAGNENRLSAPTITDESLLPMVPSTYVNGYYNARKGDDNVDITVFWVWPDGTPLLNFGETEADLEPYLAASPLEQLLPNAWNFRQNSETGQWQLNDMRYSGG